VTLRRMLSAVPWLLSAIESRDATIAALRVDLAALRKREGGRG
jgi:hypothetical protein